MEPRVAPPVDPSGTPFSLRGHRYAALLPNLEKMGGALRWREPDRVAEISLDGREAHLAVGESKAVLDGREVPLPNPVLVIDGVLYVPQSFFADVLNRPI